MHHIGNTKEACHIWRYLCLMIYMRLHLHKCDQRKGLCFMPIEQALMNSEVKPTRAVHGLRLIHSYLVLICLGSYLFDSSFDICENDKAIECRYLKRSVWEFPSCSKCSVYLGVKWGHLENGEIPWFSKISSSDRAVRSLDRTVRSVALCTVPRGVWS